VKKEIPAIEFVHYEMIDYYTHCGSPRYQTEQRPNSLLLNQKRTEIKTPHLWSDV
jgi:hypothetical protein